MLLVLVAVVGCGSGSTPSPSKTARLEIDELVVVQFCGNCHRFPEPGSFARHEWRGEVEKAYAIHRDSGRYDLRPPPREAVIAWYESRAPESLVFNPGEQLVGRDTPGSLQFTARPIPAPDELAPAIARFGGDFSSCEILAADMTARASVSSGEQQPVIPPASCQPGWALIDMRERSFPTWEAFSPAITTTADCGGCRTAAVSRYRW